MTTLMTVIRRVSVIIVVVTGNRVDCVGPSSRLVSAVNGTGYLSSLITARTGLGAAGCPWLLRAGPGQRISLSLLDFTVSGRRSTPSEAAENEAALKRPPSSQRCVRIAIVREVSPAAATYRRGEREVCSSRHGDSGRERTVYLSESNELEVVITTPDDSAHISTGNDDYNAIFLLRYDGTYTSYVMNRFVATDDTIRYDTIRYGRLTCAQKLTR